MKFKDYCYYSLFYKEDLNEIKEKLENTNNRYKLIETEKIFKKTIKEDNIFIFIYLYYLRYLKYKRKSKLFNYEAMCGRLCNHKGTDTKYILHLAAKYGSKKIKNFCLMKRMDINVKNSNGYTPLFILIRHYKDNNIKKLIDYFINNGANIWELDRNNYNIINILMQKNNFILFNYFISKKYFSYDDIFKSKNNISRKNFQKINKYIFTMK